MEYIAFLFLTLLPVIFKVRTTFLSVSDASSLELYSYDNLATVIILLMFIVLLFQLGLIGKAVQERTLYYYFFVFPVEGHAAEMRL